MKIAKYFNDLNSIHVNTLKPRSYFIPFTAPQQSDLPRESSESFFSLSGEWDFKLYSKIEDVPEKFDDSSWDKMPVPSNWQLHGYEITQYINMDYQFPTNPPFVPFETPCGVYRRKFEISKPAEFTSLVFEGVDSGFYVFINDRFVGYSQVAHSTSEFDVTDFVVSGDNTITVIVMKWCTGSYFEAQDKFRLSGIFRDVYLLSRPAEHITDYTIVAGLDWVTVELENTDAEITLFSPDGEKIGRVETENKSARFKVEDPKNWTAETPVLYRLEIAAAGEYIYENVGLREIKIENSVLLVNDTPIKIKGVNRHDSYPDTGYAATEKQMLHDLELMKEHNINAVRTSHYPNDPRFLQMCDKMGFYVFAEADIESHGMGESEPTYNMDSLMSDPAWYKTLEDRVERLISRDKNRPCVIAWSMGNESGYGENTLKILEFAKRADKTRITHYESAGERPGPDVYSHMYSPPAWCDEFCGNNPDKPFVLCEYSHAMGNSSGDEKDYWDVIYSHPCFCGGFVWEWCCHAFPLGKTDDGRVKYGYGGDFNEPFHSGHFCLDGLVTPDRTPTSGLLELKYVIQPVKIEAADVKKGEFKITNLYDFIDLSRLECKWELTNDGAVVKTGSCGSFNTKPHESENIKIDYDIPETGSSYIKIMFFDKDNNRAFAQFCCKDESAAPKKPEAENCEFKAITETDGAVTVSGNGFDYRFDKNLGAFTEITINGRQILKAPVMFNVFRAPTDNDCTRDRWRRQGFDKTSQYVYSADSRKTDDGKYEISVELAVVSAGRPPIAFVNAVWTIDALGGVTLASNVKIADRMPWLPRFGVRFCIDKAFRRAEYYGKGPGENYADKRVSSYMGVFSGEVSDLFTDYIFPQENGNHCNTKRAFVSDDKTKLRFYEKEKPFDFSALPYSQEELDKAEHNFELNETDKTVVCIDYMQSGIGSSSCGYELIEKYRLDEKSFDFSFCFDFQSL